jgi:hypothetical protein
MTEIFTQPPAGGAAPGPSHPGGSTDKKLTILIGFSVVFLIAALGTLGWVVLSGGNDGKRVETAQRNEADNERDAASKDADESRSTDEAARADDSEEAAAEEADVTLPKATVPPPDPVKVTPQVTGVSFERPAVDSIVCTGEPLAYSGAQLVDGDENYGWGASMGDAAGATADMRFAGPVKLATVGLTPGYTRLAPRSNADCQTVVAFPYNRFIQSVRWTFDDGQLGRAELRTAGGTADHAVDVTTTTVRLTIVSTTRPGSADNETVISEAAFTGTP